jgi:hypothetical protein
MRSPPPITTIAIDAFFANRRKKSGRGGIVSIVVSMSEAILPGLLLTAIEISDCGTLARGFAIITCGAVALNLI